MLSQDIIPHMKVLQVYKTYFPETTGGVEQVINQIARGACKIGVETEVFTLSSSLEGLPDYIDGHKVHRCKSNIEIASTPLSISAFSEFKKVCEDVDIIHYQFPYPFADMLHFASRINKPTLLTYQSDIVKQKHLFKLYKPLMRRFLSSVDQIVATSPNYLETSQVLSEYKSKTCVIPLGIDKNTYPDVDQLRLESWRKRFGTKFFLFIGVLRYYKGLHILVEAANNSDYPVVIVGAGPIEDDIKAHAKSLGVSNIHFIGHVPNEDKVALLVLCYAVLFPSHLRAEAFGISLLEGAMYGKPLISSEIGTGTTYINIDKETGLVVGPSDPVSLRNAMDYLWSHPEEAAQMGRRAESRYQKLFTAKKMVNSYVSLYEMLLNKYSASSLYGNN